MAHRVFDSKKTKYTIIIVICFMLSVAAAVGLYILSITVDKASAGQALAGSVASVTTLIGSLLIMIQLKQESSINCAKMLSDLNFSFTENERLMLVYRELQKAYKDVNYHLDFDNNDPNKLHDEDLMAYMTFFETLNEYIHHGVLTIGQMNDLFGDRFFKLIHNRDVQERELYAEPSSYVNIFELYESWLNYRRKCEDNGESRIAVRADLAIPDIYVKDKLYVKEVTRLTLDSQEIVFKNKENKSLTLSYRRLFPADIVKCHALQDEVYNALDNKDLFVKSTDDEFFESYLIDYCYGLFNKDELVAISIVVLNRETKRNLSHYTNKKYKESECVTFDSVQVSPRYRGYGIQSFFLNEADKIAKHAKAKYILATFSPDNVYSKNNFLKHGYEIIDTLPMYENKLRNLVKKDIL